ncbi:MAG: hypothetical protein K2P08_07870 [Oscillospiraceae bacterium]|nr:hypothetical protein [Oscillospiraceae bacterium]
MATRTKIKISDAIELRKILDDEYEKSSQVKLCKYALLLAAHILTMIDYEDRSNPVITGGYAVNERWQAGNARMHDVRQAGFQIHQLAKNAQDIVTQTALRMVGQAVAAGHMREHAMVASDYAVKVINLRFSNDMDAVRQERLWQIETLSNIADNR